MRSTAASAVLLLSAVLAPPATAAPAPDLAACPRAVQPEGWERERTRPLPVPAALRGLVRADLTRFAVATLDGGTICADTSWIERAEDMALSPDGRFLSFGWLGYESYGHIVVDRAAQGTVIETGVKPVFSPSGRRFAAADQTESEFGSLSGLAVWEVGPAAATEVGRIEDLPRMYDWRIDRWWGESCIELSALPLDLSPDEAGRTARARFRAVPATDGWRIARAPEGCAVR